MTAPAHVEINRNGSIAILRLNRAPANAVDLAFAGELEAGFAEILRSDDVQAVVFTGTGAFFSAGLDLKIVPTYGMEQQRAMVTAINRMVAQLYACPLPVVGAINGHAIAGGLILALACDYRVGTSAPCKIGITEARAGIPFPAAAMAVLRAELAPRTARVLTLLATNIDPAAALESGVLDELQPPERVLPTAIAIATDLAAIPREAYARIKHQLRGETIEYIEEMLARGTDPALESWLTAEASTASAALLKKD